MENEALYIAYIASCTESAFLKAAVYDLTAKLQKNIAISWSTSLDIVVISSMAIEDRTIYLFIL